MCVHMDRKENDMFTRTEFEQVCDCFCKSYSSVLLIGATEEQVIEALDNLKNWLWHFQPEYDVVNGKDNHDGSVEFDVSRCSPDIVHYLTNYIHEKHGIQVTGYAEESWEDYEVVTSRNGKPFDGYTAAWDGFHGLEEVYDDGAESWNAHFIITDKETGITFSAGAGAIDHKTERHYAAIVDSHR